jgi:hypothetical protein
MEHSVRFSSFFNQSGGVTEQWLPVIRRVLSFYRGQLGSNLSHLCSEDGLSEPWGWHSVAAGPRFGFSCDSSACM